MSRLQMLSLTTVILGTLAATAVLADPPGAWDVPDDGGLTREAAGPGAAFHQAMQLHLQLGNYYLLEGNYAAAQEHFLAAASLEPPARPSDDADADAAAAPRGRHGAFQGRAHAYLMAAVASELSGQRDEALALAETGRSILPDRDGAADGDRAERRREHRRERAEATPDGEARPSGDRAERRERREGHGRRGRRGPEAGAALDRFVEDPAAFAARFAGGPAELESRLMALESELSENGQ